MNYYTNNNRDSSSCCCKLVTNMVSSGRKSEFMAGTYICAGYDGRITELNDFPGIKILEFNLLVAVAGRQNNPTPGVLTGINLPAHICVGDIPN